MSYKVLVALLFTSFLGIPAKAQSIYPIGVRSSFLYSCIIDGGKRTTVTEATTRACMCVLDKIQAKFAYQDFLAMIANLNNTPKNRLALFIEEQIPNCF